MVQAFKKQGLPVFGTELNEAAIAYYEQEAVENYALILGNEGSGVSPELLAETTKNLLYSNERSSGIIECRYRSRRVNVLF